MHEVEVKFVTLQDRLGYGFSVRVRSTKDPKVKAGGVIEPGAFNSAQELVLKVRTIAGAAAEHLATQYGETHDANRCAKMAEEALKAELLLISDLRSSYGNKIKILEGRIASLSNRDQEVLHRISWAFKRDSIAVPLHEKWMDNMIRLSAN